MDTAYRIIENQILSIHEASIKGSSHEDYRQLKEFINAGELSLALEHITLRLLDQEVVIPVGVYKEIENLAKQLNIQDQNWKAIRVY